MTVSAIARVHQFNLAASVLSAMLLALFGTQGCSTSHPTEPDSGGGPIGSVFPNFQDSPSWSSNGLLAYRDNGIVCLLGNDTYLVDPALAGIWLVDPTSGASRRAWVVG